MEAILGFIVVAVGWYIVATVLGVAVNTTKRVVKKVVTGKDTYFGPAQIKFVDENLDLEGSNLELKRIMFRGAIPVPRTMNVGFNISAFDTTDEGGSAFVISLIDSTQEQNSPCYNARGEFGQINEGMAMTDWVQLGAVVPNFIQGPTSGNRTIEIVVTVFDLANPPKIDLGFEDGLGTVLLRKKLNFEHVFTEKGYQEAVQDREEAQSLSLKIGVAVAMADGSLDDAEGEILKNWIVKEISIFSDEKQARLKSLFNDSLKEGYAQAESGDLALTPLVERLSLIGEKKTKYDAIELCLDVMAADGAADPEEMAVIRKVARSLDLDMDEIEKMREGVTLDLTSSLNSEEGLESLVGIESAWSNEEKRTHLRKEFQKWSNRLNALPEGDERVAAQNMLDSIAALRKKYD